jgi:ABC-type multidrug transport system fused ATPase/permease subunit
LRIEKGESVGIIGQSGVGKTTLINVMLGLIRPNCGAIYIDNQRLTDQNLKSWQHIIGYVQQEVYLVDGSIADNVALGVEPKERNAKRIANALERACLNDLVAELPQGIESAVGERGAQLSVGQKQRIGIARAIYSGAQVLLLDEATSALDHSTEEMVTESIRKLAEEHYTTIIVAHRLSTLKHCNRILELKDGRLFEMSKGAAARLLRTIGVQWHD